MIDSNCTIQQTDYCWHRLPCGYCAILNIPCPTQGNQIRVDEPIWKLPEITCETKEDADNG